MRNTERRSFLSKLKLGALGAAVAGTTLAQVRPAAKWEPTRHKEDDWLDEIPGKHRMVFDTTSPTAFGEALLFANNFIVANRTDYGLENRDLALVIVARHISTAFGYNDAMWDKYGVPLAAMSENVQDPKTKAAPKTNPYNIAGFNPTRINELTTQGVQFAVCAMASRRVAGSLARSTGGNTDDILRELSANLIPNARLVPAGIVAVNRAQERGFSFVRP
jgi:intracellular sulfur oxidation DsrE/DsrF family protein